MYEKMNEAIRAATDNGQKMAMFHYQVLTHAAELQSADPAEFCRVVGVHKSFATEFRKMLALARLMREQGVKLA